jgi:CO dehydrogenase maturation factor
MSYTIAISGKGGVGKTTVAGLIVASLIRERRVPVLAVDADPNTCLDGVLGVTVTKTVGGVREEAREIAGKGLSSGISKQQLLELKIEESLIEAEDFDLIAMGRPEGPGCYCYANNVLKATLARISSHYPFVVLDNEAGLENLSRRIVQEIDLLIMVTDPSLRGLETVRRLYFLAKEMGIKHKRLLVVVNKLRDGSLPSNAEELRKTIQADEVMGLQEDEELADFAEEGKSLLRLSQANTSQLKLSEALNRYI